MTTTEPRTNEHGQRIGRPVDRAPRRRPEPWVLEGRGVRLEPLGKQHVADLYAALCAEDDDRLWTYLFIDRPRDPDELASLVRSAAGDPDALGRRLQRSRAATEAMYLLMRHVFDDLGYRRYECKCDSLNEPSRRPAARLGFVWEGRFRNALVHKGRNRDTDWYSITDGEWPRVRTALEEG